MKNLALLAIFPLLFGLAGCSTTSTKVFELSGQCVHSMDVGVFGSRTDMDGNSGRKAIPASRNHPRIEDRRRYGNIGANVSFRVDLTKKRCED